MGEYEADGDLHDGLMVPKMMTIFMMVMADGDDGDDDGDDGGRRRGTRRRRNAGRCLLKTRTQHHRMVGKKPYSG